MSRYHVSRCALLGVAAALGLALITAATTQAAPCVAIDGRLSTASPVSQTIRPGCYYFVYRLRLDADEGFVFQLISKEFDAYLVLLDSQGRVVARDDNSGGGTNSRIAFTAPEDGWYELMVTTARPGARGSYLVLIQDEDEEERVPPPPGKE
jgi:hypothetical protein